MRTLALCLVVASTLIAGIGAPACGGKSPTAPSAPLPPLDEMVSEKTLGSPAAPNTIIEYSALTCSHCADFHLSSFPELKRKHIDTGNVRYMYRDFPLDVRDLSPNNAGLSAAMAARCAGNARYFDALDALFRTQATWYSDPSSRLASALSGVGMSQATVSACLALGDLRNAVLQSRSTGQSEFGVNGTPTFLVNGNKVAGNMGLAALEAYLK